MITEKCSEIIINLYFTTTNFLKSVLIAKIESVESNGYSEILSYL